MKANKACRLIVTAAFAGLAFSPIVRAQEKVEHPYVQKLWHGEMLDAYTLKPDGRRASW